MRTDRQQDEWNAKIESMRQRSLDEIKFSDAISALFGEYGFWELSDNDQREVVQAWIYPDVEDEEDISEVEQEKNENKEWFTSRASDFDFHPFGFRCSICSDSDPAYVGVTKRGIPFQFCRKCRDEMQGLKDTLNASPERFGV